ncbi:hypothetical protein K7N18_28320 [Burkholderia arboris]|uniref:hypothetical protein n=1 Tax=Burkholderia arboris TaxID=488730 RepID=UPI001CA3FC00|nr:hypothetical protein [Burkholderia arboris]MBY8608736.1 hypothetical protein [Burkholderia arboris]
MPLDACVATGGGGALYDGGVGASFRVPYECVLPDVPCSGELLLLALLPSLPLCDDSLEFSVAAASRLDWAAYNAPPSAVAAMTFFEPELLNPDFFDVPAPSDGLADERAGASYAEELL